MSLLRPKAVPSLVSVLMVSVAWLSGILALSSKAEAFQQIFCSGCQARVVTTPRSGDTGLITSCQGGIELQLTIVLYDGTCQASQSGEGQQCVVITPCKYEISVAYKARSCYMDLTEANGCDAPPHIAGTYAPSYPNFTTIVTAGALQACGSGCSLSYSGFCDTASGPCAAGATISANLNCSACTQLQ